MNIARAMLVLTLLLLAGCELVADFDRDKIPVSRPDASAGDEPSNSDGGAMPPGMQDASMADASTDDAGMQDSGMDGATPMEDAGTDPKTDASTKDPNDDGDDAGSDQDAGA